MQKNENLKMCKKPKIVKNGITGAAVIRTVQKTFFAKVDGPE